jgi:hypothetical protein
MCGTITLNAEWEMSTSLRAQWVCDICRKPIEDNGYLDFSNGNSEVGFVGGYPMESQDKWDRLTPAEQMHSLSVPRDPKSMALSEAAGGDIYSSRDMISLMRAQMSRPANVTIRVYHFGCDPDPDGSPYFVDTDRIGTLDQLVEWLNHLEEKEWFGKAEMISLINRWYSAAGGQSPFT